MKSRIVTACALLLSSLGATMAGAVEITVLSTQATEQAYRELVPQFEKATGHTVKTTFTGTLDVKKRIAEGQAFDLLIMSSPDIDAFITLGMLVRGSRVDLAKSGVGVGVKAGAPKPNISTTEAFKKTLTGVFVGTIVASGEVEIGIQQVSEMSHFAGVDYVGALPADIQKMTIFSSGIAAKGQQPDAAKALVKFLTAPSAADAFKKRGMEPG